MENVPMEVLVKDCMRTLRVFCGYNIDEMAKELGITHNTYVKYEGHDERLSKIVCYALFYIADNNQNIYAQKYSDMLKNMEYENCYRVKNFVEEKLSHMNRRRGFHVFSSELIEKHGKKLVKLMNGYNF